MLVGLNLLYLLPGVVGGTETYAAGLLKGLRNRQGNDYLLFVNRESVQWASAKFPEFSRVVCPINGTRREHRYYFEQVRLPGLVKNQKVDLLHSLGYTSPLFIDCPTVVTVHDLNFKSFGQQMPARRRLVLSFFVKHAVHRSTRVIAVSEFSRNEILKHYKVSPKKIVVTYEAAEVEIASGRDDGNPEEEFGIRSPYFVAFSSVSPNKNIPRLLDVFARLKRNGQIPQRLVLIGHQWPGQVETEVAADVIRTGYVDGASVSAILRKADFLVFPSLYEGFGLPVLEAMAAGVPVVSSHAGSLPEVAGDAALFFDPLSDEDMAEKIRMAATSPDLRDHLRAKGLSNVKRFSWDQTAGQTEEVYKQAVSDFHAHQ